MRPPSNADSLGSQLLGYRVYIRELLCAEDNCVEKKTISEPGKRSARIGYLSKFYLMTMTTRWSDSHEKVLVLKHFLADI